MKSQLLGLLLLVFLTSGCVATQGQGGDSSTDVLDSLTNQQKMTLLAMLESYDSHQEAIESWQNSQASVARLVEIENDLKLLIMQLNSLSEEAEEPAVKPAVTSSTAKISSAEFTPEQNNELQLNQGQQANKTSVNNGSSSAKMPFLEGYTIQLTAVISMGHLRTYWQQVKAKHSVMFSEASPFYEKITTSDGADLFRLKVGRFDTKAEAMSVCREFAFAGGACFVTDNVKGELL